MDTALKINNTNGILIDCLKPRQMSDFSIVKEKGSRKSKVRIVGHLPSTDIDSQKVLCPKIMVSSRVKIISTSTNDGMHDVVLPVGAQFCNKEK